MEENLLLNRVKRTRICMILLKIWLAITPLIILYSVLSTLIYLNSFTCHIRSLTAQILTERNTSINWMIPWLFILLMDLFILTQTQLERAHKFIPAFAECHSKNPQNLSITQLSFYKAALSISCLSLHINEICDPRRLWIPKC